MAVKITKTKTKKTGYPLDKLSIGNRITSDRLARYARYKGWSNTPNNRKRAKKELVKRYDNRKDPYSKEISIHESAGLRQICFGRCHIGGTLTYAKLSANNQHLMLVYTLTGHFIIQLLNVYFDGERVPFTQLLSGTSLEKWLNLVFIDYRRGEHDQTAIPQLITDSGGEWTADHRQQGCAHVYLRLTWDDVIFQNGIPDITFELDGYNPGYGLDGAYGSPAGKWGALPGEEFWRNPIYMAGRFIEDSTIGPAINWASNITVFGAQSTIDALHCKDQVALRGGGSENRYKVDQAVFDTSESFRSIIQTLLSACDGYVIDFNSAFFGVEVLCDRYREPAIHLTESDILQGFRLDTIPEVQDQVFGVRGTITSRDHNHEETSFPPVYYNTDYTTAVPNFAMDDISLPAVSGHTQAQRLAKQHLYERLHWIEVSGFFHIKAFPAAPGETVTLTLARYGFTQKKFKVFSSRLAFEQSQKSTPILGVWLRLRETSEDVYDYNANHWQRAIDSFQPLVLPLGNDTPPSLTNVQAASGATHAYVQQDGTVVPRIYVSWDDISDEFVRKGGQVGIDIAVYGQPYYLAARIPADYSSYYLTGVVEGQTYTIRISAFNSRGSNSGYTYLPPIVVQARDKRPSDVTSATKENLPFAARVNVSWVPVQDPDLRYYRIRINLNGTGFADAIVFSETQSTVLDIGLDYTTYPSYQIYISAVNTLGYESLNPALAVFASSPPAAGTPIGLLLGLTYS